MSSGGCLNFFHKIRHDKSWRCILVCGFTAMLASYTAIYPFTYLPDMIKWFGYKEEDKAFYTGIVGSSYFIGKALFSYFWGWLSDKKGRKPVIIGLLFGAGVTCLAFGFSINIYMAIAIRFLDGVTNAVLSVTRALLHDNTNDKNRALGMTVLLIGWCFGFCFGMFIGGYMSSFAEKYPDVFDQDGFFGIFPFFIPNFIGFALSLCNGLMVFLFVTEEKRSVYESLSDEITEFRDKSMNNDNAAPSKLTYNSFQEKISVQSNRSTGVLTENLQHCNKIRFFGSISHIKAIIANSTLCKLLKNWAAVQTISVYALYSYGFTGMVELLPAWMSTSRYHSGLGFSSNSISFSIGPVLFVGIIIQGIFMFVIGKKFTSVTRYIVAGNFLSLSMQLYTLSRFFPYSEWIGLVLCGLMIAISYPICKGAIYEMINNCAPENFAGSMNGLADCTAYFMKTLAPISIGSLLSWSLKYNIGAPIDSSTAFVFCGVVVWVTSIIAYFLPRQDIRSCTHDPGVDNDARG